MAPASPQCDCCALCRSVPTGGLVPLPGGDDGGSSEHHRISCITSLSVTTSYIGFLTGWVQVAPGPQMDCCMLQGFCRLFGRCHGRGRWQQRGAEPEVSLSPYTKRSERTAPWHPHRSDPHVVPANGTINSYLKNSAFYLSTYFGEHE
jgi:hypothetical protein